MSRDYSKEAFIDAITKLAEDAEFRQSFFKHYHLWLHPPMIVEQGNIDWSKVDMRPGAITYRDKS